MMISAAQLQEVEEEVPQARDLHHRRMRKMALRILVVTLCIPVALAVYVVGAVLRICQSNNLSARADCESFHASQSTAAAVIASLILVLPAVWVFVRSERSSPRSLGMPFLLFFVPYLGFLLMAVLAFLTMPNDWNRQAYWIAIRLFGPYPHRSVVVVAVVLLVLAAYLPLLRSPRGIRVFAITVLVCFTSGITLWTVYDWNDKRTDPAILALRGSVGDTYPKGDKRLHVAIRPENARKFTSLSRTDYEAGFRDTQRITGVYRQMVFSVTVWSSSEKTQDTSQTLNWIGEVKTQAPVDLILNDPAGSDLQVFKGFRLTTSTKRLTGAVLVLHSGYTQLHNDDTQLVIQIFGPADQVGAGLDAVASSLVLA